MAWMLDHAKREQPLDVELLKLLRDERNFHHQQIMAVNGRTGFLVAGVVASALIAGPDIRASLSIGGSFWSVALLGLAGVLLLVGITLYGWALQEHWRIHMIWVRRFETAINRYAHGDPIDEALQAAEEVNTPRVGGEPGKPLVDNTSSDDDRPSLFSAHPDHRSGRWIRRDPDHMNTHARFGLATVAMLAAAALFIGSLIMSRSAAAKVSLNPTAAVLHETQ